LEEDEMETERKASYRNNNKIKTGAEEDYDDENAADIEDGDLIETDAR
jgi:hypothetical protein